MQSSWRVRGFLNHQFTPSANIVIIVDNICRKSHVKYTPNKLPKYISVLSKAKHVINQKSLLILYFSEVLLYLNWRSGENTSKLIKTPASSGGGGNLLPKVVRKVSLKIQCLKTRESFKVINIWSKIVE